MEVPLVGRTSSGGGTRSGVSIGMLGRGRGETVQRWPTVGFFTSLRPIGAHATRQSSREQGIVLQRSREVG